MKVDLTDEETGFVIVGLTLLAEVVHNLRIAQYLSASGRASCPTLLDGMDRHALFKDVVELATRMVTCRDTA